MNELQIVATILIKEDYKEEFKTIFRTIVDETHKEPGCISYKLYQDVKNPLKYYFLEEWKDKEALAKHNDSDHFKAFASAIDGKIDGLIIDTMKEIY